MNSAFSTLPFFFSLIHWFHLLFKKDLLKEKNIYYNKYVLEYP